MSLYRVGPRKSPRIAARSRLQRLGRRILRLFLSLSGVMLLTWAGDSLVSVNATTIGFAYLMLVLVIASVWGFSEAALASIAATLTFNYFFLPPVGEFTIADPQNWVAL